MTPVEFAVGLAAVIGPFGSIFTAVLVYRAERAKAAAQDSSAQAGSAAEEAKLLNLKAEQLREGLLDDNTRLQARVARLEERTNSLENENIRLRRDLAECLERPRDGSGAYIERRGRYTRPTEEEQG